MEEKRDQQSTDQSTSSQNQNSNSGQQSQQQQTSGQQNDQNPQDGEQWNNYRTREMGNNSGSSNSNVSGNDR